MKHHLLPYLLAGAVVLCGSSSHGEPTDPVDTLARLSLDWVKTRAETARAETTWASQRELLESTVHALESRASELESKRDLLAAKTAKERGELDTLEIENQQLAGQFTRLEAHLKSIDERLAHLRTRFPPRLSQALEMPFLSLAEPDLSPGDRMAHTITVINRCAQFSRSVTFGEEILALPGQSQSKLLQTVYWGMSHGYAYDRTSRKAWVGSPGPEGWTWTSAPESAAAIRELIATFDEKAVPTFVAVPAAAGRPIEPSTAR